jgi:hypothetical protein
MASRQKVWPGRFAFSRRANRNLPLPASQRRLPEINTTTTLAISARKTIRQMVRQNDLEMVNNDSNAEMVSSRWANRSQ